MLQGPCCPSVAQIPHDFGILAVLPDHVASRRPYRVLRGPILGRSVLLIAIATCVPCSAPLLVHQARYFFILAVALLELVERRWVQLEVHQAIALSRLLPFLPSGRVLAGTVLLLLRGGGRCRFVGL